MVASILRGSCLETGAGRQIGWRRVDSQGPWLALSMTRARDYSALSCRVCNFPWGLGVSPQPMGQTGLASSGGHGAPSVAELSALSLDDSMGPVDVHHLDLLVHLAAPH
jgi:hypothetical protein